MEFKVAEKCQLHAALLNAPIEYSKEGYMVTITAITAGESPKTKSQKDVFQLWCGLLAEQLNDAGLDQRVVLAAMKDGFEIPWQGVTIHENLWNPIQAAVIRKAFAKDLPVDEYNNVYNILHKWLSELGWPCPAWPDRWNAGVKRNV